MTPLIILAVTFGLLWVLFILPQQRRVRAHQALVASVEPGDEVVLSAGIHGRIVELGAEDMTLEVAPGVVLRVARQAILRRMQAALGEEAPGAEPADTGLDEPDTPAPDADGHPPSDPGTADGHPPSDPGTADGHPPSDPGTADGHPPSDPGTADGHAPSDPGTNV